MEMLKALGRSLGLLGPDLDLAPLVQHRLRDDWPMITVNHPAGRLPERNAQHLFARR